MKTSRYALHSQAGSFRPVFTAFLGFAFLFTFMTIEAYAQISGSVYLDINSDGVRQNAYPFIEPGVEGISVTAYNAANMSVGATTTAADGTYSLAVPAGSYRVEFTWTYTWLNPGVAGSTTVQFVTAPAANVNLAVLDPALFNDDSNPHMVSPCYVGKEYNGLYASMDALVGFRYNSTGTAHGDHIFAAQHQDIGATWGLAYNKVSKRMFVSATARRHVGFGPQGPGAVYIFNYNDPTAPVADGFIDLSTLLTTTADPRTATSFNGVTNATSWDPEIFDLVGKMSFGDIEISEDGNHLWVMNLSDRMVYRIDISGLPAPLTAGDVTAYGGLDPGCANGDYRPWALKIWRGEVYAGVVCSGQTSQNINDVNAWVMKLTGGSFTPFYGPIALDFTRGKTGDPATSASTRWQPWVNTFSQLIVSGNTSPGYPQPILSDIEFDVDGSIILGFMDRTASQMGRQNLSNDTGSSAVYSSDSGGDILRVCNIGGTYFIEGSVPGCTTISPPHPTNPNSNRNLGINGQEYYWGDFTSGLSHSETAQGALAFLPGTEEVVTTTMVPIDARTGGVRWMSNTTGAATDNYEIVDTPASSGGQGKSNGLGDMELLLGIAPIEIGNRVWNDTNNNGVQDPGESGIAGVEIELWADTDGNGSVDTKVAQTTTNAQGLYLFSEAGVNAVGGTEDWSFFSGDEDQVETLANYQIRISTSQGALTGLSVTLQNSAASGGITSNNPLTDIRDSDIDIFGRAIFATGGPGENNHGLDAGFSAACGVTVASATPSVCDPITNTYTLSVIVNYVNQPAGQITISTSSGASQNFTPDGISPDTYILTGLTANGVPGIDVTAAFVANPACTSTLADAYNAPINCTPVCAITALTAVPSTCDPVNNQYSLSVTVTYENPPTGNITITTTAGASQSFTPTGSSPETFVLTGLNSDGTTGINVTASFDNDPACTYTLAGAYDAPENCEPCEIMVDGAVATGCDPLTNTYSLNVTVSYAHRPTGNIRITADGVSQNFVPSAPVGGGATQTFTMTGLSANGTMNMSVTARFINDPACTITLANVYDEPADCAPVCEITAITATPGLCDIVTNTYSLTVDVTYSNAPSGNIVVETSEGATNIVPVTASVQTIVLTGLNSDGTDDIDVTVYFEDSPGCTFTLSMAYDAPDPCQQRDWGDLRDNNTTANYPTNSTNGGGEGVGPSHIIVPGLKIGNEIDPESNGQQSTNADGDDNVGTSDDEDGVTLPMLIRGTTVTVPVNVLNMMTPGAAATLYAYFDFNNNKILNDVGEVFSVPVPDGTNGIVNLTVPVPAGAVLNTNIGVRFRLSTDPVAAFPTGPANNGEVEDYLAQAIEFDWGDLPDLTALAGSGDYQTTASNDGPRHRIYTTIRLGASVDAETDGQPNATATGDGADENGVTFPELIAGQTAALTINVRNVTGTQAKLVGFFDWDNDGNFSSPAEMVSQNIANGTTGNITMNVPVPATAERNTPLGVRFRISTDLDFMANMLPTGMANNGEVEDYMVQVVAYDWGDLRDNNIAGDYPTNAANGGGEGVGPSHRIVDGLKIGDEIDFESDGQPATTANGDDTDQTPDDEDGVTLPAFFVAGTMGVTVPVNVMNMMTPGANATLYGFIDFNNNGVLNDAGETASISVLNGTNSVVNLTFNVPANAVLNTFVGARFRLSTYPVAALPAGRADDGEVEDYRVEIRDFDWGDLPDLAVGAATGDYRTNAADNGPRHRLGYGIKFGALVDGETDGQPSVLADGDDSSGDDEDGVTLPTFIAGRTATVPLQVMNMKGNGVAARISAWFDWNNNGELELSERVSIANAVPDGYSGPFDLNVNVPVSAVLNTPLGMRFRISQNNVAITNPTGEAFDGEVEDYLGTVVGYDWGDLPDQNNFTAVRYPTNSTISASEGIGPSHRITPGIRIGAVIDAEATGQSSTTAGFTSGGDDANGVDDDEDGVTIPALTVGTLAIFEVRVLNTTGTNANLYAFFDWNRDGDFDDLDERVTVLVTDGTDGIVNVNVTPPEYTLAATNTFSRFRLSTDAAAMNPVGEAMDGEVEDYRLSVTGFDRGDLPDSGPGTGAGNYRTTLADNGATHTINQNLFMGTRVDAELDGQPNVDALRDDNTTSDDEDGVMIPSLIAGQTITIPVQVRNLTTAVNANLHGYIDFNNNGDLSDPGEQTNVEVVPFGTAPTTVNLTITVPIDAILNTPLGARFRLGQGAPSSVGNGSAGEVEDYMVSISGYDYGDLPAGYPVTLVDDGPRHLIVLGIRLGSEIDADADGPNSPNADGDDAAGLPDDEDAVALPAFERGQTASVNVQVTNSLGVDAKLVAFFDWDNNGDFNGVDEMVSSVIPAGTNGLITLTVSVPANAVVNTNLGVRFRLSSDPDFITNMLPTGAAADGEVEDYLAFVCYTEVTVVTPAVTVCQTASVNLTAFGATILPAGFGGVWSTSGDGVFLDASLNPSNVFGTAVFYIPGSNDRSSGTVTLILTAQDPDGAGPCVPDSATMTVTLLKVDCGSFPWNGN